MKRKTYIRPCSKEIIMQLRLLTSISLSKSGSKRGSDTYSKSYIEEGNELSREFNWFDDGYDDEDY